LSIAERGKNVVCPEVTVAYPSPPVVVARVRLMRAAQIRIVPLALEVAVVTLVGLFLAAYVSRVAVFQGDLRTYLTAARAALAGLDPYAPGTLDQVAGRHLMPFVYPPIALLPFLPLTMLPAPVAMSGFVWLKILVLMGLVFLAWRRALLETSPIALILVALWGANRSAQWDLSSGNIATLEAALLFLGFAFWARGRRALFAGCVVAASVFKLTPAVFLLLLLVPLRNSRPRPGLLVAACGVLAALVVLPMLIGPGSHWIPFYSHAPDATLFTVSNPSSLGLFSVALLRMGLEATTALWGGWILWVFYATGLLVLGRRFLRSAWIDQDAWRWIMTAVLLYVLLHPRVMAYGFVLATPAMCYFMPRPFSGRVGSLLWGLVLCAQGLVQQLTSNPSDSLLVLYAPLLFGCCTWLLAVGQPVAASRSFEDRIELAA
jgi:hypothetical protein